jgi:hypothetical protein
VYDFVKEYDSVPYAAHLKWGPIHINTIPVTAKANQSLGFIKRNLKVHSPAIKEHAFKALVRPKLEYCNTIWDPHTQQQKLQIEKIQRRAARYVSNRYHNTSSVTDMMSDLNWAPLEVRRIRYRLIFF